MVYSYFWKTCLVTSQPVDFTCIFLSTFRNSWIQIHWKHAWQRSDWTRTAAKTDELHVWCLQWGDRSTRSIQCWICQETNRKYSHPYYANHEPRRLAESSSKYNIIFVQITQYLKDLVLVMAMFKSQLPSYPLTYLLSTL